MGDIPAWLEALGAVLVFLIGGGTLGPWFIRRWNLGSRVELETALERRFATLAAFEKLTKDINEIGGKVMGVHRIAELATENADTALTRVEQLEERMANQWERITERLAHTAKVLDDVSRRVESVALEQARTEGQLRNRRHGDAP